MRQNITILSTYIMMSSLLPYNFAEQKFKTYCVMEEKQFSRQNYPLDILGEFGLSEEMIYDLPDFVHETIERGGKSPLLPICVEQPFGVTRGYAKFSLIDTEDGIDVLFYPKLTKANLDAFNEEQKTALLAGKVIVADVDDPYITQEGVEDTQRIKAFVQLDKDTNGVIYAPTQAIGRNLNAVGNEYDLTGEDLQRFWEGGLVTVRETNDEGGDEPVTIGVDLSTETGVIVVPGTAEQWENIVRRPMPKYSFGSDGCWVNRDGRLSYVPENDFTKDIMDELESLAKKNGMVLHEPDTQRQDQNQQTPIGIIEEEQRQLVR